MLRTWFVLLNVFLSIYKFDFGAKAEGVTLMQVQALINGTALLPCYLTSPIMNDTYVLVVWYKDEHTPIYSYDIRESDNSLAKHWKAKNLEMRGFFRTMMEPSILNIDNVKPEDEGEYRCRIDYLRSPTKNFKVWLTVIVPPKKPIIVDEGGNQVAATTGPYQEGHTMVLICIVTGGKPPPTVKWWKDDQLLKSTEIPSGFPNVKKHQLIIKNLQRTNLHSMLTCQASNNNMSQPLTTTTSVELYFRPLYVEIINSNGPFSAKRPYEICCQAYGSRPTANISWYLDDNRLMPPKYNYSVNDTDDGNVTVSTMSFVPTRFDNERLLICTASNQLVDRNGLIRTSAKLNVFYVPILQLSLGTNLNPDDIEEGDDVYFECKVSANPKAYKILWKHNDDILQPNQKNNIIISEGNLAIRRTTRDFAGNFSCLASNVEGDGESNVVELKILYKPICLTTQKLVYGVATYEKAYILCQVKAYPPPFIFKWSFNNSADSIDLPQNLYHSNTQNFSSVLSYTPMSDMDYGTLMCWANNLAGGQQEPCVFHIIAASRPEPPYNCTVTEYGNASMHVGCVDGFDGGQKQRFYLEIRENDGKRLRANLTNDTPTFDVTGVENGKSYNLKIYAGNSKGRSEVVMLAEFISKFPNKDVVLSSEIESHHLEIVPILGICLGVIAALLLITIIVLGNYKLKLIQRYVCCIIRPNFPFIKKETSTSPSAPSARENESIFGKDEKNPDVIPEKIDSDSPNTQTGSNLNNVISVMLNCTSNYPQDATLLKETYSTNGFSLAENVIYNVSYTEMSLLPYDGLVAINDDNNRTKSYQKRCYPIGFDDTNISKRHFYLNNDSNSNSKISPMSSLIFTTKPLHHCKEVVTIRTPLMGYQQESCV